MEQRKHLAVWLFAIVTGALLILLLTGGGGTGAVPTRTVNDDGQDVTFKDSLSGNNTKTAEEIQYQEDANRTFYRIMGWAIITVLVVGAVVFAVWRPSHGK